MSISSRNYLLKSPLKNKRQRGSNYRSTEYDMLFLTPLFSQIKICTRFFFTHENYLTLRTLLKQKHYPPRTYLHLTFNYCLQCTGDLDKRWHFLLRTIHPVHLHGLLITYQQNNLYIYICTPPLRATNIYIWALVPFITWCWHETVFIRRIKQNNVLMFWYKISEYKLNIW